VQTERMMMPLLIGLVGIGCMVVLYPFWSAILWAAILVYSTWPVFLALRRTLNIGNLPAAIAMVVLSALVIAVPLALAVPGGTQDVNALRHSVQDWLHAGLPPAPNWLSDIPVLGTTVHQYWSSWAADISVMERFFRPYFGLIVESGFSLLLGIAGGVLNIVAALFIAFFFWWGGESMSGTLGSTLRRIGGKRAEALMHVTKMTVRGVVYGILGTAIMQGFLTAIGLWLSGVPRPVMLGALAAAAAVLPVGAPLVWISSAVWLLVQGHTGRGIFLAVYGVVVVSGAESVLRPYFIARGAQQPFLLTMLGVLGGALAFGLLGVFLGPVLLGLGYSLVLEFAGPNVAPEPEATSPEAEVTQLVERRIAAIKVDRT
jgi:predicted PurR-regulated permease PerM